MAEVAVCPLPLLLVANGVFLLAVPLSQSGQRIPSLIAGVVPGNCASKEQFVSPGRHHGNTSANSVPVPLDLGSPGSSRGLWLVTALLNGAWVTWSLSLVLRHDQDGCLLYRHPRIVNQRLLLTSALASDLDLAWRILWEFKVVEVAPVLMVLQALTSFHALAAAWCSILKHAPELYAANRRVDAIFLRYVVTAGLGARGTFCLLQGVVSLTLDVVCKAGVSQYLASTVVLCILASTLFLYMLLDVTVLEKFTRTTSSMYDVISYYFVGIAQEDFSAENRNYVFVVILLFVMGTFYVFRLAITCQRNKTDPLFSRYYTQTSSEARKILLRSYNY